jgi:hypothetical protein
MAPQLPASCRCDGWAVVAGLPPQAHCCSCGWSISPGHGVVPGGAQYANRLERLVILAQKLVGVVRCGVWVIVVITCVVVSAIHLPQCHRYGTMLAREKQQVAFGVDSPYTMIWYYSTARVTFDPAKFLSFWQVSNLGAKFELDTISAKFEFGCQIFSLSMFSTSSFCDVCQVAKLKNLAKDTNWACFETYNILQM